MTLLDAAMRLELVRSEIANDLQKAEERVRHWARNEIQAQTATIHQDVLARLERER